MFCNVKHELVKKGMSVKDFSVFIGVSEKTAQNKLRGRTPFTYPEAEKIQRVLFPEYTINYLFSNDSEPETIKQS